MWPQPNLERPRSRRIWLRAVPTLEAETMRLCQRCLKRPPRKNLPICTECRKSLARWSKRYCSHTEHQGDRELTSADMRMPYTCIKCCRPGTPARRMLTIREQHARFLAAADWFDRRASEQSHIDAVRMVIQQARLIRDGSHGYWND